MTLKASLRVRDRSYMMRLTDASSSTRFVDARTHYDVKARYINDCRHPLGYNVRFEKREEDALVVATRRIYPGEELYVDYGKWYWVLTPKDKVSSLTLGSLLRHQLACKEAFEEKEEEKEKQDSHS